MEDKFLEGKTILVCEDNALNAKVVSYMLQQVGACVMQVSDGGQAVEVFTQTEEGQIDAILMDVHMPVYSGIEATRRIRSQERCDAKTVPVFALTADVEGVRQEALEAGMTGLLAKPLDMKKMYRVLEEELRG